MDKTPLPKPQLGISSIPEIGPFEFQAEIPRSKAGRLVGDDSSESSFIPELQATGPKFPIGNWRNS
jgi:hypothetical protein